MRACVIVCVCICVCVTDRDLNSGGGGLGVVRGEREVPVTKPGGPEGSNERDEPHGEDAGDQASAEDRVV